MNNVNRSIRRQDRVMDESRAFALLEKGEYGFLSMQSEEGGGYGVPVNYVWDAAARALYIHCAPQGRKLRCLAAEPRVSFCVVGHTCPLPAQFATEYESVLLQGRARTGLAEAEKKHALMLLVRKYCHGLEEEGRRFAEGALPRLELIRMDAESWSAKAKS